MDKLLLKVERILFAIKKILNKMIYNLLKKKKIHKIKIPFFKTPHLYLLKHIHKTTTIDLKTPLLLNQLRLDKIHHLSNNNTKKKINYIIKKL